MGIFTGMKKVIDSTLDQHSLSKICPSCQGSVSAAKNCDICDGMGKVSRKDLAMFNDDNLRLELIKRNKINRLNSIRQQIKEKDESIQEKTHQADKRKCLTKDFKEELINDLMLKTSDIKELDFYLNKKDSLLSYYSMNNSFVEYQILKLELVSFIEEKLIARSLLLAEVCDIPEVMKPEEMFEIRIGFRKKFVAEKESINKMLEKIYTYDF